jgi:hypothetical protein
MVDGAPIPAAESYAGCFTRGSLLVTGFGEAAWIITSFT